MSEISLYEAQVKKMQGLCDEHDLVYRFKKDSYPITFTIKPAQDMESQMSMLENVEDVGYRSPDASMTWIFEDGTLTTKVQGGTFTIGKTLRTKIEAILVKMINYWQQFFFRDIIEKRVLAAKDMPTINDDDGGLPEGAEPLEQFEDEDDGPGNDGELPGDGEDEAGDGASPTMEDPDIKEAVRIVRAANAATASLLQREMSIGYAKAARIIDWLEELGVVGPFNGSQPREVLPYDEPDDLSGEEGLDDAAVEA